LRLLLTCTLLACAAAAAPADDPKDKTNAEKLVGTWKLVASSQGASEDVTFIVGFTKDGKMTLRIEPKEKDAEAIVLKGTYKLDKDKIDYTMDNGAGGQKKEILTIKTLTADDLVTVDPDGIKEEFKRVKEKKDEKKVKK
jgi:uncharacterized protein (TIGR03066 family)